MSDLSEALKALRNAKGLSQSELSKALGISKSSINMYERGEREPSIDKLLKIAAFFGVDMNYLTGQQEFDARYQRIVLNAVSNVIQMPKVHKIPLIGDIACGTPVLAVENIEEEVFSPDDIHADFALRCKGDSMVGADIQDGDIVYIRQQPTVNDGQIAAVLIEDEATLKRVYYDAAGDMVTLISENPAVPPRVYHGEALNHIRVLGLAVGLTRKL